MRRKWNFQFDLALVVGGAALSAAILSIAAAGERDFDGPLPAAGLMLLMLGFTGFLSIVATVYCRNTSRAAAVSTGIFYALIIFDFLIRNEPFGTPVDTVAGSRILEAALACLVLAPMAVLSSIGFCRMAHRAHWEGRRRPAVAG